MSQLSTITNVPPQLDSDLQHNSNENDSPSTSSSQILLEETTKLFQIALPTAIIQLALVAIFPMTASIIGRLLDTNSLAGFSLSTLAMNMTCLSIILGSMTAADTLQPRAMAMGRYKEVGLLSIRGYIICAMILFVPVILLVFKVEDILMFLGQDAVASHLAQEWSRIYSLGIPFVLFFRVSQRFLSAQHVVLPLAVASVVGSFLFHPYSLKFWVAVGGFAGSAFAVVVTQIFTSLITVWYLCWKKPYHAETWPGVNGDTLREALVLQKVARFLKLGMGGILSFTEWWFWEALCFTAGKLGVIPLCAHTIAYQMVPLSFMIPLGISLGLTIRIGSTLPTSVHRAKKIAIWCTLFSVVLGVVVATLLYRYRLEIIYSFTNDELVIQECEKIWIYTCIHLCNLHVMAMLNGIVRALGLQMRSGIATVVVLWVCALPVIYNGSVIKNGGLVHMWKSLPLTYLLLNVALLLCFALSDWSEIRDGIVKKGRKSIAESKETASRSTENVLLLLNPDESTLYGTTMLDKPDVELKC